VSPSSDSVLAAQQAFVALLAQPLLTRSADPELYRELVRNRSAVRDRAARLGYRLTAHGRAFRLVREPRNGVVTAPTRPADGPGRRVLALALCAAAACEDSGGALTLQRVSDLVRELTTVAGSPVAAYDPDSRGARRQLTQAVRLLEQWRVVRRRTEERLLEEWADGRAGIGAGYDVDRDALVLLLDSTVLRDAADADADVPGCPGASAPVEDAVEDTVEDAVEDTVADTVAEATVERPGSDGGSRTTQLLRALVETPCVCYADLDSADAELLRATRGLRVHEVEAMTGGVVETREEGMVLVFPDEPPSPVTVDWPRADTRSWVALLAADECGRVGRRLAGGTVHADAGQVAQVVAGLVDRHGPAMSRAVLDQADGVRQAVEHELGALGLLREDGDGGWLLSPVLGRYRDPSVLGAAAAPGVPGVPGAPGAPGVPGAAEMT